MEISWNNQAFHTLPVLRLHSMLQFSTFYDCLCSHSIYKERMITRPAKLGRFLPVAWNKSHGNPQTGLFSRGEKKRSRYIFQQRASLKCSTWKCLCFSARVRLWAQRRQRSFKTNTGRLLNQTEFNTEEHHHDQNAASFPPVNRIRSDFLRSVHRRRKNKPNWPHVLAASMSDNKSQSSKLFSSSSSLSLLSSTP